MILRTFQHRPPRALYCEQHAGRFKNVTEIPLLRGKSLCVFPGEAAYAEKLAK